MKELELHRYFMKIALNLATKALTMEEVPVGALVVYQGKIIGKGFNKKETQKNPMAHAEILAIKSACKKLMRTDLSGCTLYVTVEPCPMCVGAILLSRISNIVYATHNPTLGSIDTKLKLKQMPHVGDYPEVLGGILAEESQKLLETFFQNLRRGG